MTSTCSTVMFPTHNTIRVCMTSPDWSIDVTGRGGAHAFTIVDTSYNMFSVKAHGLQYLEGRVITDMTLIRKRLHKTLNVPASVWKCLKLDLAATSPVLQGDLDWVAVDGSLLVQMLKTTLAPIVNGIRLRFPALADKPWCVFIGGTTASFTAFIGYEIDESDTTSEVGYKLNGCNGSTRRYFTAHTAYAGYKSAVKASLSLVHDRVNLAISPTTQRYYKTKHATEFDDETTTTFEKTVMAILQKAAAFQKARHTFKAGFRSVLPLDAVPMFAQCHGCNQYCTVMCKCSQCYQSFYCNNDDCNMNEALDLHAPLCAVGFWNMELELAPLCDACPGSCSVRNSTHCKTCNTFWCTMKNCAKTCAAHTCFAKSFII